MYLAPAVIDKYWLNESNLVHIGSFIHKTGYRYTSHKLFYFNNKPYICTFGHPNRLFIIDANSMELEYFQDIGIDELSSNEAIQEYLNSRESKFEIVPIEVNKSGENLIFICNEFIYIYDFLNRNILYKINYLNDEGIKESEKNNKETQEYRILTAHIDFLE